MTQNILEIREIHTFIEQFHILEGVSVTVPKGSITVLLGRNGAGKTTTLRTIMGMTPPIRGTITYDGKSIAGKRPYEIAQMGVGYVPEHRAIFKELTVKENLEIAQRKRDDLERQADFIFELFPDLKRLYHLTGGNLSGGQQQMLSIARALIPENSLLLIDEPSEGLAPVIIEQLIEAIHRLSERLTVLLVEQNFFVASKVARRYVIVDDGKSVVSGEMDQLMNDEALIQRYLGVA
ncbi:MAG: ABC transporter ATP-binding protein [Anaerolineae bacterium]|nr:ABC transporter ATP-binding protein [Anaerolineae bacterium]